MKSYKLIKTYPVSPEINTILMQNSIGLYISENPFLIFKKEEIEDYPEFWEEIKGKEWEIVSFITTEKCCNQGEIITLSSDGKYHVDYYTYGTVEEMLKGTFSVQDNHFNIHSVKRLSDGEVFTLGDEVKFSNAKLSYKLTKIYLSYNDGIYFNGISSNNINYSGCPIQNLVKVQKPLFTTEDGVAMFEGNKCWAVSYDFKIKEYTADDWSVKFVKRFSTKKAAEEYIIMNKPCLSLKDIEDYLDGYTRDVIKIQIKHKIID